MNRELIRQQLVGNKPLAIRTSDGRKFAVPHPEFVLVGRQNIVIEDENGMLDIIDPLHVVSIRPGGRRKPQKIESCCAVLGPVCPGGALKREMSLSALLQVPACDAAHPKRR
jgi:hypothetical protein